MTNKHPLHPHPIGFDDVKPDVPFVWFSRKRGEILRGTFTSAPFTKIVGGNKLWMTTCRTETEPSKELYLEDMGITRANAGWNGLHFTVHSKLVLLLPEPDPKLEFCIVDDNGNELETSAKDFGRWRFYGGNTAV